MIDRFWKSLRRRATHNRLFESLAGLKRSLRASLCDFQTVRGRVRSWVAQSDLRPANQKASAGLWMKKKWAEQFVQTHAKLRSGRRKRLSVGQAIDSAIPERRCWIVIGGTNSQK